MINEQYFVTLSQSGSVWYIKTAANDNVCGIPWIFFGGKSDEAKMFADNLCNLLNTHREFLK
jgi:hypothetical protein